ncbi:dihydrolipoyllysine-residue succinyltransferase component of 2-oxoglutarate dehydrogenase complex, mitochondrial [Hyalella azteca]|uniref:Dihydrolipoamide acetyltransferase component of pyruvate dehydrogenase complex n=1 Tax=Hyalella azteca TaxID=294128 RepID=A0A979FNR7_HYAAZ|nr:dihydrolipoyllysine-residue succinyltransferase component of 2-oxoglutarate dehydrogenase complex, mitochondrial [Hyalella azteca]
MNQEDQELDPDEVKSALVAHGHLRCLSSDLEADERRVEDRALGLAGVCMVRAQPLVCVSHAVPAPPALHHTWPSSSMAMEASTRLLHSTSILCTELQYGVVPAFAESISEGDLRWVKQVGDAVAADETVGEVETDKTTVPINSPCAGVVTELLVGDGATVSPGTRVFVITPGDAPPPKAAAAAPAVAAAAPPAAVAAPAPAAAPAAAAATAAPAAPVPPPAAFVASPRVPLSSMPVAAIQHSSFLQQAQVKVSLAAMLSTTMSIINIMELRKSVNAELTKRHGVKLGLMSAFVKASAYALVKIPTVNAVIDGNDVVYRDYVDISVAVATPKVSHVVYRDYVDISVAVATPKVSHVVYRDYVDISVAVATPKVSHVRRNT